MGFDYTRIISTKHFIIFNLKHRTTKYTPHLVVTKSWWSTISKKNGVCYPFTEKYIHSCYRIHTSLRMSCAPPGRIWAGSRAWSPTGRPANSPVQGNGKIPPSSIFWRIVGKPSRNCVNILSTKTFKKVHSTYRRTYKCLELEPTITSKLLIRKIQILY